jgi:V/A-type H+-transporting ATPase subunit I
MRLWTPAKKKRKVLALIEEETEGLCSIEVEENLTDAPILLENPPVIRSFEMLTKLFSPPKYREVDPTPFIAPTFALFFGLMLTDAVYGTVLALAAWQIAERYGRYSKSLKDVCVILMACGVSAVFWGILTGSILGDFLGKYVLGGVGSQTVAVWLDPMYGKNAVTFLALVVTIGLAHLFTGYAIGLYYALKDGRTRDALLTYGSWFILAGGVAIIILAGSGKLPENTRYAGYLISAVGVALSLMRSSFMALMEITGLVGNALSYARLLALALTTSGIAMTFNFLASNAVKVPYVGFLLAALVFIFGHVMNILINTLGGFVHSLRLHYLEFFGTFYQGGGREFTPFTEERKYTKTR